MTDCVEWNGGIRSDGYGYLYIGEVGSKKQVLAHRWAYEQAYGEIPAGLVLDHLCRNRGCVEVTHLEPVTIGENVLRGDTLPARQKAQTHCIHGHSLEDAYLTNTGKRVCRECAKERAKTHYYSKKAM